MPWCPWKRPQLGERGHGKVMPVGSLASQGLPRAARCIDQLRGLSPAKPQPCLASQGLIDRRRHSVEKTRPAGLVVHVAPNRANATGMETTPLQPVGPGGVWVMLRGVERKELTPSSQL